MFVALAGCALWGFLAPTGLLLAMGLLSAFAPFAHLLQQLFEPPPEARIRRR